MRILSIIFIGLLLPIFSYADGVSPEQANKVAKNYFVNHVDQSNLRSYDEINLILNENKALNENHLYIFSIEGSQGFVITSTQDFTRPVLAFSDKFNINLENLSPELKFVLDGYTEQIQFGLDNNAKASKNIQSKWQALQFQTTNRSSVVSSDGPLLLTTWNQSPYYNDMCPMDPDGVRRSVVGCVAVAMAQVMKYYDYPATGEGYHNHNGDYINYSNESYSWSSMPTHLTDVNEELAKLMYHCGHTIDMNWTADASGTQSFYIPAALKNNFHYSSSVNSIDRQHWSGTYYYTDAEWEQIIRNEIDAFRPIVYSGHSDAGGHAWNCDGYQSDGTGGYLYHMNYGWGGSGNGYFAIDNLISESVPGGDDLLFDSGHEMVIGIKPEAANYPEFCSGTRTINGFEGVFGDGSGNELYENNINCNTVIYPDCARGGISLSFVKFDLAAGDYVNIYDGASDTDPLIATLDANYVPADELYESSNEALLIKFVTNSSGRAGGWDAKYKGYVCANLDATAAFGTVSDGSGSCDYEPSTSCNTFIKVPGATQTTLTFTEFNVDSPDRDYVMIYDLSGPTLLHTFKASTAPTGDIVVPSGDVRIRFRSYSDATVGTGWTIDYSTISSEVEAIQSLEELIKVYPNPFKEDAFIEISNPNNEQVNVLLTDIVGKKIASHNFGNFNDKRVISLKDITDSKFSKGVYILNIQLGNEFKSYKLFSE